MEHGGICPMLWKKLKVMILRFHYPNLSQAYYNLHNLNHIDISLSVFYIPLSLILSKQFPPFGEVVDYQENTNGTITLFVDGVWIDYNSDCAFKNQIVIQPFEDGTWRYLFLLK